VTTTGEITILNKNIYDPDVSLSELRKSVGMVFQRPNPLPISIYENVLFGIRVHTARKTLDRRRRQELVEEALREVDLWDDVKDQLRKKATRLTLEQQQKLCIARLLPLKPRIILMDEPCSALDADGTAKIEELLDGLRERYTVLIVTHNMAQARRASDECIFMLMGELIEHGPTSQVFLSPQRQETEMYVEGRYG
jgi:phosphate transport system ATP-binding protein